MDLYGLTDAQVERIARAIVRVERSSIPNDSGEVTGFDGPNVQVVYVKTVAAAGRRKYKGEFLRSPQTFVNFYNLQETSGGAVEFAVGDYVWITTTDFDYLKPLVNETLAAGDNWVTASSSLPLSGLEIKQINAGTPDVKGVRILKVITSDPSVIGRGELDVVDEPNAGELETVSIRSRQPVRKNSSGLEITRRGLNFIEGSNITLTLADGGGNDGGSTDEVKLTIAATGGGSGIEVQNDDTTILDPTTALNIKTSTGFQWGVVDVGGGEVEVSITGGPLVGPTSGTSYKISAIEFDSTDFDVTNSGGHGGTENIKTAGFDGTVTAATLAAMSTGMVFVNGLLKSAS